MRHTLLFVGARIAVQVDKICLKCNVKRHTIMSNLQIICFSKQKQQGTVRAGPNRILEFP